MYFACFPFFFIDGLTYRLRTIVDATIITAPSSTKNTDKARDPEMSSLCKNNSWHFGMKMHIGVDAKNGLIHSVASSTGKVSDREKFADLLHGEENTVFGNKGYVNKIDKHYARDAGVFWGVLDKRGPGKDLSNRQKKLKKFCFLSEVMNNWARDCLFRLSLSLVN